MLGRAALVGAFWLIGGIATAFGSDVAVKISPDTANAVVETPDGPVTIERIQDLENEISGYFAKTSRECPPFCIQPASPADGVTTIGELELIDLLRDEEALVVDARTIE